MGKACIKQWGCPEICRDLGFKSLMGRTQLGDIGKRHIQSIKSQNIKKEKNIRKI
jgi:hypothetical protein